MVRSDTPFYTYKKQSCEHEKTYVDNELVYLLLITMNN
jgi:hypothetical protein